MKTFHEWLVEQRQCEGLWLNDKNAVVGLSKLNPLPRDSAVNKSLSKQPARAATPTVKPAQPATLQPFKAKAVGKAVDQRMGERESSFSCFPFFQPHLFTHRICKVTFCLCCRLRLLHTGKTS